MTKQQRRKTCAIAFAVALSSLATGLVTPIFAKAEGEPNQATVQGITYNTDDFTVTQDAGAYVDGTVYSVHTSGAHTRWIGKVGSKVRLDAGRNGLMFTSKASGNDAEGKKVTLASKQLGDFTMDFRVFSKESAVGGAYVESAKGENTTYYHTGIYSDQHNPFQDMRRVDITFTSVSAPDKFFTVNVFGNDTKSLTECSASVHVSGDEVMTAGHIYGYGICDCAANCYGNGSAATYHKTRLPGNTFTNSTNNTNSAPTSIWFDAETMRVYGKIYNETLNDNGSGGVILQEEYRLIRDMRSTPLYGASVLNPADFAAGYTVDIAVGDMTANDTPLKRPEWDTSYVGEGLQDTSKENPSPYYRNAAVEFDVDGDGTVDTNYTYDRYANFIIYDINGAEMDVKDGWTVEETTLTTAQAGKVGEGIKNQGSEWTNQGWYDSAIAAFAGFGYAPNDTLQGLKFTSKTNNNNAVGEGFTLNVDDFTNDSGAFAMKIGAEYDPAKSTTAWIAANGIVGAERGLGDYAEAIDQYSNVKEIKLTFRSTVDSSKAFNLYLVSRTASRNNAAIYAEIEGETYVNSNLHRGWALGWLETAFAANEPQAESGGSLGSAGVTDWGESDDSYNFPIIQFDPVTMTAYGYSNQKVQKIRELGTAYSSAYFAGGASAKLNSADFYNASTGESTYTVTVSVERMNTKENFGTNTMQSWNGMWSHPTVNVFKDGAVGAPTEGWDHTAVIHVYKLYGDKSSQDYDLPTYTFSAITARASKTELDLGNVGKVETGSEGVQLNVRVMDTFGEVSKPTEISYSGASAGTLTLENGVGTFRPSALGEYVFALNGMTRSITVVDASAPVVTFVKNFPTDYFTKKVEVGFDDIVITDNYYVDFIQTCTIYKNGKTVNKAEGVGEYTVVYYVQDFSGNSVSVQRQFTIADTSAPTLTVGYYPTEYTVGDTVCLPVVTATDDFDSTPQITYEVTCGGNAVAVVNDSFVVTNAGEYKITIRSVDSNGNQGQTVATVTVREAVQQSGGNDGFMPILLIGVPALLLVGFAVFAIIRFRKKDN